MRAATPAVEWRPHLDRVLEEGASRENPALARCSCTIAGSCSQQQPPPCPQPSHCRRRRGKRGASYALLASITLFFASGMFVALGTYLTIRADMQHTQGRLIINASWFHTREEWDAHEPKETVKLNTPAKYLVLIQMQPQYYCDNNKNCSTILKGLQEYHTRNCGLTDIAYNYLLSGGAVGEIYEGRGAHIQGQHTDELDALSLGIGFMDDYANENVSTIKKHLKHFAQFLHAAVQEGYLVANYGLRKHKNNILVQNISESSNSFYGS